jgi:hypothetical protein
MGPGMGKIDAVLGAILPRLADPEYGEGNRFASKKNQEEKRWVHG